MGMNSRIISTISLIVLFASFSLGQRPAVSCQHAVEYGNRNQVDPSRSTLNLIAGRVIAEVGEPAKKVGAIPACLGLFTETDHRLVASAVADEEGRFRFKRIQPGLYRLVVRDRQNAFCVANMPLRVVESRRGKTLVIHMRPSGVDDCSYGDFK
jgi:hypothetical protein